MTHNNSLFEKNFSRLTEFYELKNPKKIHDFIKMHENLLELLDEANLIY